MKSKISRKDFITQSAMAFAGLPLGLHALNPLATAAPRLNLNPQKASNTEQAMKISIFSKNLHWLNYADMAHFAADIGFDGIDLTVRPDGHVIPERVKEDLPKAVKAVERAGLKVYTITTGISDPDNRQTVDILQTAGALGIQNYRTGWFPYNPAMDIPKNLEAFKKQFAGLARLNEQAGIRGGYQNHAGVSLGAAVWDLWLALKDVNSEWMGCQYDIRHATVEASGSWATGLDLIQKQINTLVIKDFHWELAGNRWQVKNVPLGKGMVDFKQYFSLVKKYNISCPISLHYEYPLGGAENGAKKITIPKAEIARAFKNDLVQLKTWLKESELI